MICQMVDENTLTPGRYVGIEDDGIPFKEKLENMTAELAGLFAKSRTSKRKLEIVFNFYRMFRATSKKWNRINLLYESIGRKSKII